MIQNPGTLGGNVSAATAINASGHVTGYSIISGGSYYHAFLWSRGVMQDLGAILSDGNSHGNGVNDSGQVTAYSTSPDGFHGFLWNGTSMQDLGTLGGSQSFGFGINSYGPGHWGR